MFIIEILRIGGNQKHSTCLAIENWSIEISYLRLYITYIALQKDG